jgi:ribosomal protein S18 acetylase RimI-like enzyme
LSQVFKIRVLDRSDYQVVIKLISDIIVNEFKFKLEFESLDSDLLQVEKEYGKANGGCFWVAVTRSSSTDDDDNKNNYHNHQIIGTIAIRNLKHLQSTCELKRMYILKGFRRLGIGQRMLDIAIDFARNAGYSRMVLDSSKNLDAARKLYLKAGFVDIPRYNDNYRADVFMERKLK